MEVNEIAFSDGSIEAVSSNRSFCDVLFVDWRGVKWRLRFEDVLAIENLNIEGEDLDRLEIGQDDAYVSRIRQLVGEPVLSVTVFDFYCAWGNDSPRLRVVASSCKAEETTGSDTVGEGNDQDDGES